jgi:hypothetical protein
MIDLRQLRAFVLKPALTDLGLWSQAAEELLVGTGLVESLFTYLRQLNNGPALGFWQMEPATHDDLWMHWLRFRPRLAEPLLAEVPGAPHSDDLVTMLRDGWRPSLTLLATNLRYAAMAARLHYRRVPELLPAADDVEGMAQYWKMHWNTELGKGNPAKFVLLYREHALA